MSIGHLVFPADPSLESLEFDEVSFQIRRRRTVVRSWPIALALAATVPLLASRPAAAQAPAEAGIWLDDTQQGAVEIYICQDRADRLCGRIVWLREPLNAEGKPKFDRYNPNAALQGRPICGLPIIGNLAKSSDGGFDGGWIYDPKAGKSYSAAISLSGSNTLTVTGYLGMKFMGKSFTWTRAPDGLQKCMLDAAPAATPMKAPVKPAAPAPAAQVPAAAAPATQAPAAPKQQAQPAPAKPKSTPTGTAATSPAGGAAKPTAQAGSGAKSPSQAGSKPPAQAGSKPPAQAGTKPPAQAKTAVSASPVITDKPKPPAKATAPAEAEALPWQTR